jgi:acyl carrier protein
MDALELELKRLIVSALKLEDLSPEDIGSEEPLFGDSGLGLDSIDALELGVALRKTYDIKIETVSDEVKRHFASIRNLAQFIRSHKEATA